MIVNLELYKVFYYVASTLSFSEAANALYISQSAVSQSIKTLENKLGVSLFARSTKRVKLTPEGEILLRHIEPAINMIKRGESNLVESNLRGGQIRIGASDTICRYFLVPYLEKFHQDYPLSPIKVINATSIQCVELLEKGDVDLIIVNFPNNYLGNNVTIKEICSFKDVFVASNHFNELKGKKLSLKDLLNHPILMLEKKSTTSEFLHTLFQQEQLDLVPEIELASNDLLIDLAKIGLGIAFVPDFCLTPETSENLFVVETKKILPERKLALVHNNYLPVSKALLAFIKYFDNGGNS